MKHAKAVALLATTIGLVGVPSVASARGAGSGGAAPITTVATGLSGPRQINDYIGNRLLVAESDSGQVSSVDIETGAVTTLLSGLFSPQGVAYSDGLLYVAVGGPPPPGEGPPPPAGAKTAALVIAKPGGPVLRTIDLLAYELKHNPDGQVQFVQGKPVDALSNPFSVLAQRDRVLVADAGANDVLAVDKESGRVSTFFVPPTVKQSEDPLCTPQAQSNPGTLGCDPVPTGVVQGPDGLLYVSTLGALVPGASRVYVLTQSGRVVRIIDKLEGTTGVEVDSTGAVYAAELTAGAPMGPPPANFDASTVGQIVRIDRHGHRTYAQVTTPSSVEIEHGQLYSTAFSVGLDPSKPVVGQLVRVSPQAFTSAKG
jgi:hypothetical protein